MYRLNVIVFKIPKELFLELDKNDTIITSKYKYIRILVNILLYKELSSSAIKLKWLR